MMTKRRQPGFTLLEATIAMILLAVAAAGVLLPFANANAVQAEGARRTLAANLASELMETILSAPYANIVAVYDGYSESAGAMRDAAGQLHSGAAYTGFSRSAVCLPVSVASTELIAVTVTVTYNGTQLTRVTTLVADHE